MTTTPDRKRTAVPRRAVAAALAACAVTALADEPARPARPAFAVHGALGRLSGETHYEIDGLSNGTTWKSRLEFPLDVTLAALEAAAHWSSEGFLPRGSVGLRLAANLDEPEGAMTDRDWIPADVPVAETASRAELRAVWAELFAQGLLYERAGMRAADRFELLLAGAFLFERLQFDVYGMEGWYAEPLGEGPVFLSDRHKTLAYESRFYGLYLGGETAYRAGPLRLSAVLLGGPVLVEDRDEHLLRAKRTDGVSAGLGARAQCGALCYLNRPAERRPRWFLKADAELRAVTARGTQDQEFTDGSQEGPLRVDLQIESRQTFAALGAGCEF